MKYMWPMGLVIMGVVVLAGAQTVPATTSRPAMETVAITVPGQSVTVTIQYPKDWKQGKYPTGQPFLFKPGAGPGEVLAEWELSVRSGLNGRTLEELVGQYITALGRRGDAKLVEKKIVDLGGGKQAASVFYTSTIAGTELTCREYFTAIDRDRVLDFSESGPSSGWKEIAPVLREITDSAKTEVKAAGTAPAGG